MGAWNSTLAAFFLMLLAGGSGVLLARRLPEDYVSEHALKNLRIAMALVGTMSSLLLGLMINSSRYNYSEAYSDVQKYAAAIQVTNLELHSLGTEACSSRRELQNYVKQLIDSTWETRANETGAFASEAALAALLRFDAEVRALKALTDEQKQARGNILSLSRQLIEYHWKVSGVARTESPTAFIAVVISWFCLIFWFLGVFAPRNPIVLVSHVLAMAAIAGAIFLVKEMGEPFTGPMRISPAPLDRVLLDIEAEDCAGGPAKSPAIDHGTGGN